jgi:dephospho-CoA kinase
MLRVGLTGDLGSGKSTVAKMLAARGAVVLSSDEMARHMMQPGEPVYNAIVASFGPAILAPDNTIDRRHLARIAFDPANPRIEELNAIVHPPVLAAQAAQIEALAQSQPNAIVVVESALIFTTRYSGDKPWRDRFDRILLVTTPQEEKIARFLHRTSAGRELSTEERTTLEADARKRLAEQRLTEAHASECLVLRNNGTLRDLELGVDAAWQDLQKLV